MLGAHNDLTALKEAELKTATMLQNRERFFARMSHEIRTPLHGMIGVAEVLQNADVDSAVKTQLSTMLECGRHLQHLLNDLLTLSKIDENKFSVSIEDVSLASVIEYIESLFRTRAEAKALTLSVPDIDLNNYIVRSDQVRLTQIVSNIMSNAIKFTYHGCITINVNESAKGYVLTIADTGDGISDIDAVLRAYYQEALNKDFTPQGTGLGLEIVDKLCRELGHQLDIQSTVGEGTQVSISLEKSKIRSIVNLKAVESQYSNTIDSASMSVLVVDDNEINREIAKSMLQDTVGRIDMAVNGKEAVDMVAQNAGYDVVLMDLSMPVKNGFDAAREINALSDLQVRSRIIALSADAFEGTRQRCEKVGMSQHVAKPFTRDELLKAVLRPEERSIVNN
jgi:CheY-like chemotaxis protein